ncbi:TadE/TadG family type IV pilus assembly protein [Sphingomonas changnyeongensis]|uniref:TadE/TadG family type IV pilus assembly protein n=1 Tax=Sphingomonas changnyeongensis TaxID=2698679 RepID=UPI001E608785|nr:TadE/TadG family type IV pilus assembly protein [Sphingomonas changnyeongensis]
MSRAPAPRHPGPGAAGTDIARRLPAVLADARGSTMMEFALIAPTMLLMLLGGMDLAYRSYVTSIVEGEVQRSGRDSTIQGVRNAATRSTTASAPRSAPRCATPR